MPMSQEALDRKRTRARQWQRDHPGARRESVRRWREKNPEDDKRKQAEWREKNREYLREKERDRLRRIMADPEKHAEFLAKRREQRARLKTEKRRRETDPNYKIKRLLRSRVKAAIKGAATKKYASTMELLGCTVEEVRRHIESLWKPGMTWGNHGQYGWHIDHIRPCASFDLTDPAQQRQCFHWSNLQPLWAEENLRKSSSCQESGC